MMYDAPAQQCITFSSCSGWRKAKSVMWGRIPDGGGVNFYEEEECQGRVVDSSQLGVQSNSHELSRNGEEGDTVRSLLVVKDSRYPVEGMISRCESARLANTSTETKVHEWANTSRNNSTGSLSQN
ncbi:hypothetical protein PR001_g4910 [Phytophthora rubi]|uniref:Uncharacterized protein n=2 Tax=Phytophthora rubi TaxID=129364 RepID=A0A6A3NJI5_9STRA|nr:hypothetical protein PR001_g4910 [Phytophthora rubi]